MLKYGRVLWNLLDLITPGEILIYSVKFRIYYLIYLKNDFLNREK